MEQIITGLDIGTTKVCAVEALLSDDNRVEILGVGSHPCKGLNKGAIINVEETVDAIHEAVREADIQAENISRDLYVGIAGSHIKGQNSSGIIVVANKTREITEREIERVVHQAHSIKIPDEREIIHVLPWEFKIDDQNGLRDPRGMTGKRLESKVHIVTGSATSIQNLVNTVRSASYNVKDIVLEPLASSESVLREEEKEMGVVLIDLGGGTADVSVFIEGSLRYTFVVPLGGNNITKDISILLKTSFMEGERVKIQKGQANPHIIDENEKFQVGGFGRRVREVNRKFLASIIEARLEEIFSIVYNSLKPHGILEKTLAGVVITGGTSLTEGIVELAEYVFGVQVRVGYPYSLNGLTDIIRNPIYSTAVGLSLWGIKENYGIDVTEPEPVIDVPESDDNFITKIRSGVKSIAKEFFS